MNTEYRIARGTSKYNPETKKWEEIDFNDYDLVIESGRTSYGTCEYEVLKNTTDLSDSAIANICDCNNFGFRRYGRYFTIYTD